MKDSLRTPTPLELKHWITSDLECGIQNLRDYLSENNARLRKIDDRGGDFASIDVYERIQDESRILRRLIELLSAELTTRKEGLRVK